MLPALPIQSVDLVTDDSRAKPEQSCLCSLLAKIRLQRFDGWAQHDDDVDSGAVPCRGDVIKKSKLQAKELGAAIGNARVACQFKHSVDDIGWYIREYRGKCSRNSSKMAKLPLVTISRQFVSFRKPRYTQATAGKASDLGHQRAAAAVDTLSLSGSLAEGGASGSGADSQLRPALTFSATSDERRKWYEAGREVECCCADGPPAERQRLTRSASVAVVPDANETLPTTGAEPTPFAKARSASVLDRGVPQPLSHGEPSSATSADAVTVGEAGFLTLEERSRRASTKSQGRRRNVGGSAVVAAGETAADVCVKEKQFIFPLPVRGARSVVGKSSTRVGAHRRQTVEPPALRVRDLGLSSKLAKTLGELIEDFRLERLGVPADRRPAAAAAPAALGGRSRSRAARAEKRTALYYHLPLANSLSGFAGGLGEGAREGVGGGGGGTGRGGRMGHAELFDYSSTASAAASYGP